MECYYNKKKYAVTLGKNYINTQIHIAVIVMFPKAYLNYLILDFWRCHFLYFIIMIYDSNSKSSSACRRFN